MRILLIIAGIVSSMSSLALLSSLILLLLSHGSIPMWGVAYLATTRTLCAGLLGFAAYLCFRRAFRNSSAAQEGKGNGSH